MPGWVVGSGCDVELLKNVNLTPALEILERRSFPELAHALRSRSGQIVQSVTGAVLRAVPRSNSLTTAQLRDGLPDVLGQMADALGATTVEETRKVLSRGPDHGVARFRQDYALKELITEYLLLRRVVVEQVESGLGRRVTTDEDTALNLAMDVVIQDGIAGFVDYQKEQLRAAVETEAKYLSFLSHDLRNSLNGISLVLEVLKRRLSGLPDFAEDIADIDGVQKSIGDTVAATERMLQAERLRKKAVKPEMREVNLHSLASEVVRQFAPQAQRNSVKLDVQVPTDATVTSDRQLMAMVLQNLVGNAVKYGPGATVRVRAEIGRGDEAGWWVVSVSDNGPGIAPDQLGRIFEAFRRGETHGREGVGLGLAIASQASELIGAKLTAESQVGVGSTFRLALPELADTLSGG